jgi:diguanylate cyclase (GGDEF)-like protein/PAS domain S-box-containing protein
MARAQPAPVCLFEAMVNAHDDAMFTVDGQGTVSSWNRAAERLFGYAAQQALGLPLAALLADEPVALDAPGMGEQAASVQRVLRDRHGMLLSVLVTRTPIDGPTPGTAASLLTVHALQRAPLPGPGAPRDRALNVYESLVEGSDDAIVTKTLAGIVTSWNPGAQRLFGFSAAEMIGESITKIIPLDRLHEEEMILQRIAAGERVEHFETVRTHKSGSLVHVSVTISPLCDASGRVVGASKIARDIGDRILAAQTIWRQANQDALTNLPNRSAFRRHLEMEIARAECDSGHFALLYADLDHFKMVNDSLGHDAGDALLVAVAARLRTALRGSDVLARLGGDEFTVLLPTLDDPLALHTVSSKLHDALAEPFAHASHPIHVSASIGMAMYPRDGSSADELLRHADLAMYEAKNAGRNRTIVYEASMDQRARGRLLLAGDLRRAAQQGELYLAYQPVVRVSDGEALKFEALMRWRHPAFGTVHPARFIPLAEETGLILELGDWVFRSAAQQALRWCELHGAPMQVSFNVSPLQLTADVDHTEQWGAHVRDIGLDPSRLVIEVTETVMLDNSPRIAQRLRELRRQGFQVAVDDFGTGVSNLAALSRIDVDYLKIDQSLVRRLPDDGRKLAICEAIVAMAHRLGIQVIAEGIETDEELERIRDIRCDFAQGYLYAQPQDEAHATQWLLEQRERRALSRGDA